MKQLAEMKTKLPGFMQFQHQKSSIDQIFVEFDGADESIYEGEHFQLLIKPGPNYPFDAPEVSD